MVKQFGMSEKFGNRTVKTEVGNELSPFMAELTDSEINKLLHESYERAKKVLREHPRELEALAQALLKHETLDADAIKVVLVQSVAEGLKNIAVQPQEQNF